jgi:hypothetical protein
VGQREGGRRGGWKEDEKDENDSRTNADIIQTKVIYTTHNHNPSKKNTNPQIKTPHTHH